MDLQPLPAPDAGPQPPVLTPFAVHEPVLTEQLVLRRYREDDLAALFAVRSAPGVARYVPFEPPRDADELRPALHRRMAAHRVEQDGDGIVLAVHAVLAAEWRSAQA